MLYQLSYASSQWANPAAFPRDGLHPIRNRDAHARVRREFHCSMGRRTPATRVETGLDERLGDGWAV